MSDTFPLHFSILQYGRCYEDGDTHRIGEQVQIEVIPRPGFHFRCWTDDPTAGATRTILIHEDMPTLHAVCESDETYIVETYANPSRGGTVTGRATGLHYGNVISEYSQSKIMLTIDMIRRAIRKGVRFRYILADSWFACTDIIRFVTSRHIGCDYLGMIKVGDKGRTKYHFINIPSCKDKINDILLYF